MIRLSERTTVLCSIFCAVLLMTAGCTTEPVGSSSEDTTTVTNTTTKEPITTTLPTEGTETTQQSETTTEGVFGSIEYEIRVKNYLEVDKNISVRVTSSNETVIFNKTLQMESNSSKYFDFEFPHTGEYTIVANTSSSSKTRIWDVKRKNPTIAASVILIGDNELHINIESI